MKLYSSICSELPPDHPTIGGFNIESENKVSFYSGNQDQGPTGRQQRGEKRDLNVFNFHMYRPWAVWLGLIIAIFFVINYFVNIVNIKSMTGFNPGPIPGVLGIALLAYGLGMIRPPRDY